jgi:hypothetical protein
MRVCSFVRPGQRRVILGAQQIRRLRRRSQRKERLRSLLLSTAGMRFPTLAADDKAEWLTI